MIINWIDVIVQMAATFVGAALGFGFTLWADHRASSRTRLETTTDTLLLLKAELESYQDRLQIHELKVGAVNPANGGMEVEHSLPFLSQSGYDSAVSTGRLALLRPELQQALVSFHEQIRHICQIVTEIKMSWKRGLDVEEQIRAWKNGYNYLQGTSEMALESLGGVLDAVSNELRTVKPGKAGTRGEI